MADGIISAGTMRIPHRKPFINPPFSLLARQPDQPPIAASNVLRVSGAQALASG